MVHVLEFLDPFPDRMSCAPVCARWHEATIDKSFHKCVLSVETGVKDSSDDINLGINNFASLESCISASRPGDTIVLSNGHHWEGKVSLPHPLRIIGCLEEPSRCVLEVTDGLVVGECAKFLVMEGVSVRRSRRSTTHASLVSVSAAVACVSVC